VSGDRARDLIASASQTVGPFFHFGLTTDATRGVMAGPGTAGERVRLRVQVVDGAGEPVPDAMVELWQADASGHYGAAAGQAGGDAARTFGGWGRLPTGSDGACEFTTIRPGTSPTAGEPAAGAAHINVCLFMRGLLRHLFTRIYFAGDPALNTDPVLAIVPPERRETLVALPDGDDVWTFVIRLQGDHETVFFDE
jgi:protocatechuate 3,4-dioxygenase alpha subunit